METELVDGKGEEEIEREAACGSISLHSLAAIKHCMPSYDYTLCVSVFVFVHVHIRVERLNAKTLNRPQEVHWYHIFQNSINASATFCSPLLSVSELRIMPLYFV